MKTSTLEWCIETVRVTCGDPDSADEAAAELAAYRAAVETGLSALRAVRADRPSAHSDAVWKIINDALAALDAVKGK